LSAIGVSFDRHLWSSWFRNLLRGGVYTALRRKAFVDRLTGSGRPDNLIRSKNYFEMELSFSMIHRDPNNSFDAIPNIGFMPISSFRGTF
jgi:hypothetical protein